jgi:hypothetical protein
LTGHYVNYRKQVSPRGHLLPEDQFRLIAVCARQPRDLFAALPPEPLRPGVCTCRRGTDAIRLVVAAELPCEERNALLHLFSAAPEQVQYGAEPYRVHSPDMTTIVNRLFTEYRVEGLPMPYTMADFRKEVAPKLTARLRKAGHLIKKLTGAEQAEAEKLLELAKDAPPSLARAKHRTAHGQTRGKTSCPGSARNQRRPRKRRPTKDSA